MLLVPPISHPPPQCSDDTLDVSLQFFSPCCRFMDNGRTESQIRLRFLVPTVLGRHDFFGVGCTQDFQERLRFIRYTGRRYRSGQQTYTSGSASIRRHYHVILKLVALCSTNCQRKSCTYTSLHSDMISNITIFCLVTPFRVAVLK